MTPKPVIQVHVSRAYDLTSGMLFHMQEPSPPAPTFGVSIEMIATQMWTCGYLTGVNKLTKKSLSNGAPYCLEEHNIGPMIPDITPSFPTNTAYFVNWPFSSRKMLFKSSCNKADGKWVACAQPWPPLPMMTCGDPTHAPTALEFTNGHASVKVGLAGEDLVSGFFHCAATMVIDCIFYGVSCRVKNKESLDEAYRVLIKGEKAVEKGIAMKIWKSEFVKKVVPNAWDDVAKEGVEQLTEFGLSALEGHPTLKLAVGHGYVGQAGVSWKEGQGLGAGAGLTSRKDLSAKTGSYDSDSDEEPDKGDKGGAGERDGE